MLLEHTVIIHVMRDINWWDTRRENVWRRGDGVGTFQSVKVTIIEISYDFVRVGLWSSAIISFWIYKIAQFVNFISC